MDGVFAQLEQANSGRVVWATHVADLMRPSLEGANTANDESPQEIVVSKLVLNGEEMLVDQVDLPDIVLGVQRPVELSGGRIDLELGKVNIIHQSGPFRGRRVAHIEETLLPLSTRF